MITTETQTAPLFTRPKGDFHDAPPELPSEIIRLGLADMDAALADPRAKFMIDMNRWVYRNPGGRVCYICMAGAIMAETILSSPLAPFSSCAYLQQIQPDWAGALMALNEFREGKIDDGYFWLRGRGSLPDALPEELPDFPAYDGPRGKWFNAMLKMVDLLEAAGE